MSERLAYVGLLVLATVVLSTLSGYAGVVARRRPEHRRTLLLFAVLMGSSAFWAGAYSLQLWSTTEEAKLVWLALANVGTVVAPATWLLFALSYTGKDRWLDWRTAGVLAIEPLLVVATVPTTQTTRLYWYDTGITTEPFLLLTRELGPLFHVHALYSYLVILLGTGILVQWSRRQQGVYRGQAVLLTAGALFPVVSNIAFQLGVGPDNINLTAPVFALSGVAFWTAIARYRLLDVVPVARESVIEDMRDGYLVVDEQDRIVDTNPAATRLLGEGSLAGEHVESVLPAVTDLLDDGAATPPDDAEGSDTRTELVLGDDSDRRYIDVSVSSLGPGTRSTLVVLRDITERRSTERRFRALIENSSDIVTVVDPDGTVEYQSPSTEQLLGYDPEDVIGTNALSYVHPDDRDDLASLFQEGVGEGGRIERSEYRIRTAEGDWRTFEALSRNLLDDPAVGGFVVNSRDITRRKRRERELAETNDRLDQFASVVSHDLRNPLNVAQGYVELLEETVDGDAATYVAEVAESHDRMGRIIDDVLALARDGTELGETEAVSVAALARDAWGNVETGAATLATDTDQTIVADRSLLERVFENLFRNAVEHGGDTVTVTVEDLPDGTAGFVVRDDGPGIDPTVRDHLFDPGVSGSSGTGLGLAIVERIVEAHGWTVRLGEEAGKTSVDPAADEAAQAAEVELSGARFEFLTGA
ncbi:histidine kinase N-terminal 7TM domain-containing protein [Haloarchaeobius amylolyticus]|uniref:histidine kinase N-terminal 7TM domain-containing protein n=1 Tax=Haloarchaeobius amylolyticus TaxID=1198296 RepID=UPI00226D70AC